MLLEEQAIKCTKARVYVYSDTVLCFGKQHGPEDAIRRWKDQVSTLKMCPTLRELQGLDGDPIDLEWSIFPGSKALDILHEIQADLQRKSITPEKFSDRRIFMSVCTGTKLEWKDNEDSCALSSRKIKEYASNLNDGHWAFLGPGEESKWYQGYATNYGGKWDLRASQMVEDFENSGHPVFQEISPPSTSMESIATLTSCTGLFIPRISSVSAEQSQSGVEQILERQVKADSKVLAKHLQKFKSSRRISSHWLIFQDYRMLRENECSRV